MIIIYINLYFSVFTEDCITLNDFKKGKTTPIDQNNQFHISEWTLKTFSSGNHT